MVIAGYVISFVTGVAVGFVSALVILFRDKLNRSPLTETKEQRSILQLFSQLRHIMSESRRPADCKSYPFCEHLKSVLEMVPGDLLITRTIVRYLQILNNPDIYHCTGLTTGLQHMLSLHELIKIN